MEFMTGVNKKETLEVGDLLTGSYEGKSVKVNGAVHTIRDMGEVAFIVLRKREGLLQCVYEEGKTQFDLKDLKEAATIEVEGTVKPEERAPHGFEIRLDKIKVLSEPAAPMPLAISKWKLVTPLSWSLIYCQIAIAWEWEKGISSPIIGATKEQYLEDAAEALSISLSADEMQYLEEAYMPHPIVGAIDKNPEADVVLLAEKK